MFTNGIDLSCTNSAVLHYFAWTSNKCVVYKKCSRSASCSSQRHYIQHTKYAIIKESNKVWSFSLHVVVFSL